MDTNADASDSAIALPGLEKKKKKKKKKKRGKRDIHLTG